MIDGVITTLAEQAPALTVLAFIVVKFLKGFDRWNNNFTNLHKETAEALKETSSCIRDNSRIIGENSRVLAEVGAVVKRANGQTASYGRNS